MVQRDLNSLDISQNSILNGIVLIGSDEQYVANTTVALVKTHAIRKTRDKFFYSGLPHQYKLRGSCGVGGSHHSPQYSEEAQDSVSLSKFSIQVTSGNTALTSQCEG